jgi:hypothetical protein
MRAQLFVLFDIPHVYLEAVIGRSVGEVKHSFIVLILVDIG